MWIFLSGKLCQITEQAIWKQNGCLNKPKDNLLPQNNKIDILKSFWSVALKTVIWVFFMSRRSRIKITLSGQHSMVYF